MEHRGRDVPIAIGQLGDKFALGTPTPVQLPHGKEEKRTYFARVDVEGVIHIPHLAACMSASRFSVTMSGTAYREMRVDVWIGTPHRAQQCHPFSLHASSQSSISKAMKTHACCLQSDNCALSDQMA